MPIEYVSGDLFKNTDVVAFAHGCNCQGSMGAGIAVGFRERYPEMYEQYRLLCKADPRQFNLGDVFLWKADNRPWVFNLGTQEKIWRARASYEAIETALRRMRRMADAEDVQSIAMPRIGVGYGGLSWKKVRVIIEAEFADWTGRLIVYEKFVSAEAEEDTDKSKTVPFEVRFANGEDEVWLAERDKHISRQVLETKITRGEILVVTADEVNIGFLRWGYFWDEIPFLNLLWVEEEYRRQGIGTLVMRHWEEWCRAQGFARVLTSTLASENAQHFYRKLGYRDTGALLLPGEPLEIFFIFEFESE